MSKRFFVLLFISIFLLPFSINVSAGIISKGVKATAVIKAVSKVKKIKENKIKNHFQNIITR